MNSKAGQTIKESPLIWDMTLAWNPVFRDTTMLPALHAQGITVVGLTIGTDRDSTPDAALASIDEIERLVSVDSRFLIIRTGADVETARSERRLGLELNFQGTRPLNGRPELLRTFHERGLRHVGLIWNDANEVGGSSTNAVDNGLTSYGRRLIEEMEGLGIVVDGAHAGYRTTMDAIEASTRPFIISHTNCYALNESYKNVKDDQIRACARTGGVMGISGFGTYLGDPQASTLSMFRHIDHIAQLVGVEHVGLGLDFVTRPDLFWPMVSQAPHIWPAPEGGPMKPCRFADHAQLPELTDLMSMRGYTDNAIRAVLGQNWLRVCDSSWR